MSEGFLSEAPEFYNGSSFPYVKRRYQEEVDIADYLTTPRLLGGWRPDKGGKGELSRHERVADADLVYRKTDGSLAYRWDLLDLRLSRFVNMGYKDLTLVLDQIPYCFTEKPHLWKYGQATPPSDMREWHAFVRDLCRELKRLYGAKVAGGFRFRLGTELGCGERISLTQKQLHEMYAMTHKGIKEVLPGARLGPWNEAGFKDKQDRAPLKVLELARFAKKNSLAFDFASVSSYAIPKLRGSKVASGSPQLKAEIDRAYFAALRELFPGLSAEYHEFGILGSQYGVATSEPGSRGGAYRAHYVMTMLEHGALDRLYHWDVFEAAGNKRGPRPMRLLRANGWLYSILEHAAGGDTYVLKGDRSGSGDDNALYKCALVASPKTSFLIVTSFAVDRRKGETRDISLSFPVALAKNGPPRGGRLKYVTLNSEQDIYRTLKSDLAKAGNLKPEYEKHDDLVASVKLMAKTYAKARKMVEANYAGYRRQMERSLTLKPCQFRMEMNEKLLSLTFPVTSDALYVFVW